jgi:hypothetical protein
MALLRGIRNSCAHPEAANHATTIASLVSKLTQHLFQLYMDDRKAARFTRTLLTMMVLTVQALANLCVCPSAVPEAFKLCFPDVWEAVMNVSQPALVEPGLVLLYLCLKNSRSRTQEVCHRCFYRPCIVAARFASPPHHARHCACSASSCRCEAKGDKPRQCIGNRLAISPVFGMCALESSLKNKSILAI